MLSPVLTEYKVVFVTLLGIACSHPCSLFHTDAMLLVSLSFTDTTMANALMNFMRWFRHVEHLLETQDFPRMPIHIFWRLKRPIRISTCKAFSQEQQPCGIPSLLIASQNPITLFLSRKGLTDVSSLSK